MVTFGWDYVRAEVAEACARLLAEGATPQQLRTVLTGRAIDMLIDECGRERAAVVLRCIANHTEWDEPDHRATEGVERPGLTVIEGGKAE